MKTSFVFTFLLLQIINNSNVVGVRGFRISQEKCDFYRNMIQPTNFSLDEFPFMVRVYNGVYLNGILISENFVLTIAFNETKNSFVLLENSKMRFEVIGKFANQDIVLLKLYESVRITDQIRTACSPEPQYRISSQLKVVCWVDSSWFDKLELKITSNASCNENSGDYNKEIRIQGVDGVMEYCTLVEAGDRDRCNSPSAVLLNDHQEIVGIASYGHPQIFVQITKYVSWIENIVWPSQSKNNSTTTTGTPSSDDEIVLSRIGDELHEIHMFLNVNLILIVLILFLVLCISCILWSDGLCVRAVLPDQCSTSTAV